GHSAFYSAFVGSITVIILYWLTTPNIANVKLRLRKTGEALEGAGRSLAAIVPLLACAAIIVALVNLSGIGIKFSELIIGLGQTNVLLTLVAAAALGLVLGMGLPIVGAYILLAAIAAPGLESLGLPILAVHMFLLYYACLSTITPPVCTTVFVASAIAKSNWLKTGWQAVKLAFVIYLIPFIFVFEPSLLLEGSFLNITTTFLVAVWATFLFTVGFTGFFLTTISLLWRILIFSSGVLLLLPELNTTIIGLVLSGAGMAYILWKWRKLKRLSVYTHS
ncbi:TRAP transporter large permease subunit, partial [Chloroflexota bacterium]